MNQTLKWKKAVENLNPPYRYGYKYCCGSMSLKYEEKKLRTLISAIMIIMAPI